MAEDILVTVSWKLYSFKHRHPAFEPAFLFFSSILFSHHFSLLIICMEIPNKWRDLWANKCYLSIMCDLWEMTWHSCILIQMRKLSSEVLQPPSAPEKQAFFASGFQIVFSTHRLLLCKCIRTLCQWSIYIFELIFPLFTTWAKHKCGLQLVCICILKYWHQYNLCWAVVFSCRPQMLKGLVLSTLYFTYTLLQL